MHEGRALPFGGCGQNVAATIAATGSTGRQKSVETEERRRSGLRAMMGRIA